MLWERRCGCSFFFCPTPLYPTNSPSHSSAPQVHTRIPTPIDSSLPKMSNLANTARMPVIPCCIPSRNVASPLFNGWLSSSTGYAPSANTTSSPPPNSPSRSPNVSCKYPPTKRKPIQIRPSLLSLRDVRTLSLTLRYRILLTVLLYF